MSQKNSSHGNPGRGGLKAGNETPIHSLIPNWGSGRKVTPRSTTVDLSLQALDAQGAPVADAVIDYQLAGAGGADSSFEGAGVVKPSRAHALATDSDGRCGELLFARFGVESGEVAVIVTPRYPATPSVKVDVRYEVGTNIPTTLSKLGGNEGLPFPPDSTQMALMTVTLLDQDGRPMQGEFIVFKILFNGTGTLFATGMDVATATTDASGTAILSHEMQIGPRTGKFRVQASFSGREPPTSVHNEYEVGSTP